MLESQNSLPTRFSVPIGGGPGPCNTMKLQTGDELLYSTRDSRDEITPDELIRATPAARQEFRTALDQIGVWGWRAKSATGRAGPWSIEYPDGPASTSDGDNSFPPGFPRF